MADSSYETEATIQIVVPQMEKSVTINFVRHIDYSELMEITQ